MNVLIASHLFPNREEPLKGVFVRELAEAVSRHACVEVLAPVPVVPGVRSYRTVPARDIQSGLAVHHPKYLALPPILFKLRWRTYHLAIQKWYRSSDFKPDVIHAHWIYPDALAVLRMAWTHGARMVVTVHGHAAFGWRGPAAHKPVYKETLHGVDHVISVSDQIKEELISEFGLATEKITVLHNGVDLDKFPVTSQEAARRRLGLPVNRRIILCVARLSPEKGLDRLIAQAKGHLGRHDWQMHILGIGPCEENLRARISSLGLENRVLIEGGIPHADLHLWYAAADVFCLSSYHEGCPVVVHESLSSGLPVVSTRVGAVPDLLKPGEDGLLCSVDQDDDLGRELDRALGMTWDRDSIARRGRAQTWGHVARETMNVYETALAGGKAR